MVTELLAFPGGVKGIELCRHLREPVAELAPQGIDWRSVVHGVRPSAALWQGMSIAERRRFLPRLRPFWEVHRHHMALSIGEQFGELRDCDWVRRVASRIVSARFRWFAAAARLRVEHCLFEMVMQSLEFLGIAAAVGMKFKCQSPISDEDVMRRRVLG